MTTPDFVRGWHEGYRAAKDDALHVARPRGPVDVREVFGRLADWNEGRMPADFTPTAVPVADTEQPLPVHAEARELLWYALHLRQYGERAPGGDETWAKFDARCEAFLRRTHPQGEAAGQPAAP